MIFWNCEEPKQKVFKSLKKGFKTTPMLAYFNPEQKTWFESNASDYLIVAILSQKHHDKMLKPVVFIYKKNLFSGIQL